MHVEAYLRSAQTILETYDGGLPFAIWLKNFFKQHKKYGSRDRRLIADLCFCFFRLGNSFSHLPVDEQLLAAQFLCHEASIFIKELKPSWLPVMAYSPREKLVFLKGDGLPFPLMDELSAVIEKELFGLSFFQQPDLFLRLRPGKEEAVIQKLTKAAIPFRQEGSCLRLPNNTKADDIIAIDEEAVVQDISSQQVLVPFLQELQINPKRQTSAWDCCAASGGKTILLHDQYPHLRLTVSDIRESILINLRSRLKRAGIHRFQSFTADVSATNFSLPQRFDIILCDAPCSGSGTWGRTPEQLRFFRRDKIDHYASLQKRISLNSSRSLKPGGFFLYITCSVFYRENEEVVQYLQQNSQLKLISQNYLKGYDKKGDTLFTALFTV